MAEEVSPGGKNPGGGIMGETLSLLLEAAGKKELPCLLIGGNAVVFFGYPRLTIDIDLLVPEVKRSQWLDLLRELGFRLLHGSGTFAQFEPAAPGAMAPVDLMFVDEATWKNLEIEANAATLCGYPVRFPRVEHLVALKLHAAASPSRRVHGAGDWEDIRELVLAAVSIQTQHTFRKSSFAMGGRKLSIKSSVTEMKPEEENLSTAILNLPVFEEPQVSHWPSKMTWEQVTAETEPARAYYMKHFYSPEERLRTKNPARFIL